jgi:hypothetical protein
MKSPFFAGAPYPRIKTLYSIGEPVPFCYSSPAFVYLENAEWEFTEMVNGMNIRVLFTGQSIVFAGRANRTVLPMQLLDRLHSMFCLDKMKSVFGKTRVCLYGEGYGPKIGTGHKYRQDQSFVLFDIAVNQSWLDRFSVYKIAGQLDIEAIPVVATRRRLTAIYPLIQAAKTGDLKSNWPGAKMEGLVARPLAELHDNNHERIIAKLKVRDLNEKT